MVCIRQKDEARRIGKKVCIVGNRAVYHVEGAMKIDFKDKDTIALVLWKQTTIRTIKGKRTKIAFRFDTVAPSPILFVSNGRVLTLTKKAGSPALQTVLVSYDCHML